MKNGTKTRSENGRFLPGENGGSHGKPGRSGRPTNAVRVAAQAAVEKHQLLAVVAKIAQASERDSDRLNAIKLLLAYGYGQPEQRIEHTGEDGGPIEVIHGARERFEGRINRIVERLGSAAMPEGIDGR